VNVYDGPNNTRRIISQGYNICYTSGGIVSPLLSNPILVERDLDTLYNLQGGAVTP
jgi:hypothetical protein